MPWASAPPARERLTLLAKQKIRKIHLAGHNPYRGGFRQ
jgi:hypothetical protein